MQSRRVHGCPAAAGVAIAAASWSLLLLQRLQVLLLQK
jgi:hypothetical protein